MAKSFRRKQNAKHLRHFFELIKSDLSAMKIMETKKNNDLAQHFPVLKNRSLKTNRKK